ncbi:hypothetical protein HPB50_019546 [Hyalomma asiaticum]|uniref:Uncharacterized protein n=1 Tax=Hyalomma asiaticum TaxID=266040 RepID=A0ACB7T0E8_HYAAI|nr:hypothetical protein HPB50_019546 [Hyalomma asiaticum]
MECNQLEKKLAILDAMHYIASAWDVVSSDTILPGTFADYVSADDGVAVCSAVLLDNIIEAVCPDSTDTSYEEEMDDAGEASTSIPTYTEVLCYIDNIGQFACAHNEIGDLLPDIAAPKRKLMRHGCANVQKKITDFFRR